MVRLPAPRLPGWLDAMVPFERYVVDLGGPSIHVMEQGTGRPVLLVHGNPTWGFLYRRVAEQLRGEPLRLIMPDLVGLGFSSRPGPGAHTIENHALWLGQLVEQLGLEGLVLVVQDWGGPMALLMASERPGLVSGLVLLNTVVGPPKQGFKSTGFHRFARLPGISHLAFRVLGFPQVGLRFAQGDRSTIRGRVARAYRYPLRGLRRNAAPLELARLVPDSLDHPAIEPLARCQAFVESFEGPVAAVWGDRDPILGGVGSWIERLVPDVRMTRTQAGHYLQEEVPETIADAVRDVVARI